MLRRLLLVGIPLILSMPGLASADVTCPAGTVAITGGNRAAANAAGIPASAECWNPGDANVGTAAGDAKLWLQQHALKSANISCLNAQFAENLEKFMQAVPGGPPTITSGYRSAAQQNNIIATGYGTATKTTSACQSYHVWGLAADFNNNNNAQTSWMRANAGNFGIATIGAWDPNHFQSAAGRYGQCGACATDTGDGTLSGTAAAGAPFDQQIRQALGLRQPPPPPPPPPAQQITPITSPTPIQTTATTPTTSPPPIGTLNSTPYPAGTCNPQTYCYSGDGNIYYRSTACVDQMYQTCAQGCSGIVCNANSAASASSNSLLSNVPSSILNTQSQAAATSALSAFDLINLIANPVATSTAIGTATPIDLNEAVQNTGDAVALQGVPNQSGQVIQTPPQGSTLAGGFSPQQTFTSGDLSNSSGSYGSQPSTFQNILTGMKATLVSMLNYLQPFGGNVYLPGNSTQE